MKRLLLLSLHASLLLVLYCCASAPGKNDDSGLIRFEYIGESDKPMLKFVFYTNDGFDTGSLGNFEEAYELGQEEFSKIEDLIEARFTDQPAQSNFYYQFTVTKKDKNKKLFSSEATVTRNLLQAIAGILENKNKNAGSYIYEVLRRI